MSYLIIFSFIPLFSSFSFGKVETLCSGPFITGKSALYSFSSTKVLCEDRSNCWLQFKAPEDVFKLELDEQEIFDLRNPRNYLFNEYFLFPIGRQVTLNQITIAARDNNQDVKFSKKLCLYFGKHEDLRWKNSSAWFFNTGSNLYSAYFLIIISFFLIFSFWLRKSGLGFSLLVYSIVSCIYLLSFSEYPRAIFDPVLASGGFHFPLRLLQDLCLVFVFYNFYQKHDSSNVIRKIAWIYSAVISLYILLLFVGIKDYIYHARIIVIMAPLVAAPMAIGTWFAFKLKDSIERKVLIPISILLLLFQLNDLLVFWKLIDSYFMVRLYIPFIVGMALFLYFRRMHDEVIKVKTISERQRIFKEFLHDVKSPLAVLRIFLAGQQKSAEHQQVIESALDRIEGMVSNVDNPNKEAINSKVPLILSVSEIVAQKRVEYPDLKLSYESVSEVFTFADKTKLQRVFSNIINNAYESYNGEDKKLDIRFVVGDEIVRIQFTDKGKGIPKLIYKRLFYENVSSKKDGNGIGLASANSYVANLGGKLEVTSKEGFGTTVEIVLKTISGNLLLNEVEMFNNENALPPSESLEFVLIDDDKYIRLSWEYFARNTRRVIKTFSTVESFLVVAEQIKHDCPIYLDLNINGIKSTKYIDQIYKLGFTNIILATGEDMLQIELPNHVRGVSGKLPPLQ